MTLETFHVSSQPVAGALDSSTYIVSFEQNINGAQLIFVTLEGILIFVKLVHC